MKKYPIITLLLFFIMSFFYCTEKKAISKVSSSEASKIDSSQKKPENPPKQETKVIKDIYICPFESEAKVNETFNNLKTKDSNEKKFTITDLKLPNCNGYYASAKDIEESLGVLSHNKIILITKGYSKESINSIATEIIANYDKNPELKTKDSSFTDDIKILLPKKEEINDFVITEAQKIFTLDNLYEIVDGNDITYKDYGFKKAISMVLKEKKSTDDTDLIKIEIYDMGSPVNAFSIFSRERDIESKSLNIGLIATYDKFTLALCKDKFYIKVLLTKESKNKSEAEDVRVKLAKMIDEKIKISFSIEELFPVFSLFPKEKRIEKSEKALTNVFDNELLSKGFSVSYN